MAGRGSRLRPHSLTIPKPMLPVAGMPIVTQLIHEIARVADQPIKEIAYVLGDPAFFGKAVLVLGFLCLLLFDLISMFRRCLATVNGN